MKNHMKRFICGFLCFTIIFVMMGTAVAAAGNGGGRSNDPIIVVPGIMGSRLFMDGRVFTENTRAWDPVVSLNGITKLDDRLKLSNRLYVRPCENQNVNVYDNIPDSTVDDYGREYGAKETYKKLVDGLCNAYAIGTNHYRPVYFFSYDWRYSNEDSARKLHAEIQNILHETGAEKVDLVCHSMGGLVASKYYVEYGHYGQVDQIITCGTPYEGAPALINSVMNWDVLGDSVISSSDDWADIALGIFGGMQSKLKASFTGVAELTPTRNYVSIIPMQKDSWKPMNMGDYEISFSKYQDICSEIFDSYYSAYSFQESLKSGSYNALLKYSKASFMVGINHKTITAVKFQYSNNDIDEKLYESDLGYTTRGDGTVPFLSASICEKLNQSEYLRRVFWIDAGHNEMVKVKKGIDWIIHTLNNGQSASAGDTPVSTPFVVIRVACPVDVTVSGNGEMLSSSGRNFSDSASFGRLDIIGPNDDIKMLCLDRAEYPVVLEATDAGTMDYSIRFFNEREEMYREVNFEDVPLTPETMIYTSTSDAAQVQLQIDADGDGVIDEYRTSKGTLLPAGENAVAGAAVPAENTIAVEEEAELVPPVLFKADDAFVLLLWAGVCTLGMMGAVMLRKKHA